MSCLMLTETFIVLCTLLVLTETFIVLCTRLVLTERFIVLCTLLVLTERFTVFNVFISREYTSNELTVHLVNGRLFGNILRGIVSEI